MNSTKIPMPIIIKLHNVGGMLGLTLSFIHPIRLTRDVF